MSWVSNSQASNQYAFQAADSQFEKNVNTPMVDKYQGEKKSGKQRMAGDYLSDFTAKFSDNSKAKEVGTKDFRGDVRNNSVSSFLGNSAPKSVTQNKKPAGEVTAQPVGDPTPVSSSSSSSSNSSSNNDVWMGGIPTVKQRVEMYENSLTGNSKAKFRDQKVATDKYGNTSPQESSYDFYTGLYQQEEDDWKWMDSYTGPKTFEEAGKVPSGPAAGAADRTAALYNSVLKYQSVENKRKATEDYYAKKWEEQNKNKE